MNQELKREGVINENEIDLIAFVRLIWLQRRIIFKITSVFVVFGVLISFTSPKEYTTSCILIPEAIGSESQFGGSLGGLASLAGINIGGLTSGGNSSVNPGLYRSVAHSTPFLMKLMNEKFYFSDLEMEVTLFDYYLDHYKTGLIHEVLLFPFTLVSRIKESDHNKESRIIEQELLALSKDQQNCLEDLKERLLVTMDWELNVVTIEVEMQDPWVAAQVGKFTQEYITKYVTNYAISKSEEQLKFVQSQYLVRKQEFENIQNELAVFRDGNQFVKTAKAKSEEERLQSKYNLSFNIYNELAQQVETIKLKINENTPVFTVLEPIKIPSEESKPKKSLILLICVFLGIIISFTVIWFKNIARQWI